MTLVWESAPTESASELLVLLTIADHADDNGENAYPGIARIAYRCRLSERRVQQIIKSLEVRGLLMVEKQAGGRIDLRSDRRPNRYTLNLDGVKPVAPREDDGVKSEEVTEVYGVKPTSPDPLVSNSITEDEELVETSQVMNHHSESIRLARLLADLMVENECKQPNVTDKWYATLDRMHRIDGRTWEEIEGAIRWSQSDSFWSSNIHSPDSLRKHFDKMRLQARRKKELAGANRRSALDGVYDYLKDQK
jgi:hypothetical protein